MDKNSADYIEVTALLKRFVEIRLPRALEIKKKVFAGEPLADLDVEFLDMVFKDAQYVLKFSDKYPEFQDIVSKGLALYTEITEKALENEKNNKK